jgi:aminoglycoside/choline kinase family phosphotransferase
MAAETISKEKLERLLNEKAHISSRVKDVLKLHGDASYRTYFRVFLEDGKTLILMQMPEGKASVSEEITNFKGVHTEPPFINVSKFLKSSGVNVAEIYHYSEKDHLMILEDLGDGLMSKVVGNAGDEVKRRWYRRAIDLLVSIQKKTRNADKSKCVALQRSFDEVLLNWEFDHFLEYGVEERLKVTVPEEDRKSFTASTRLISKTISGLPYGFTHRDFQSRNILLIDSALYLIDFQDALLGPAAYDLVSLLRDSYVRLSPALVEELIGYYCGKSGKEYMSFRREFDLITCQRKLKDAGRFVFIDRVKKNPDFLKYIPASLGYVKEALERLPECAGLYLLLKKYVPEWSE